MFRRTYSLSVQTGQQPVLFRILFWKTMRPECWKQWQESKKNSLRQESWETANGIMIIITDSSLIFSVNGWILLSDHLKPWNNHEAQGLQMSLRWSPGMFKIKWCLCHFLLLVQFPNFPYPYIVCWGTWLESSTGTSTKTVRPLDLFPETCFLRSRSWNESSSKQRAFIPELKNFNNLPMKSDNPQILWFLWSDSVYGCYSTNSTEDQNIGNVSVWWDHSQIRTQTQNTKTSVQPQPV